MKRRPPRNRGLMIYEVMLGLSLLATFAAGATFLMRSSLRVSERADGAMERAARFDAATEQLRRDVWGAAKVETPDARTIKIEREGEPPITWTVGDAATLSREAEGVALRDWRDVADGVSFEASGAALVLIEPADARGNPGRRVPFTSQVMLAAGGKR